MATAVQKITLSSSRDIPFNKLVLSQSNVRRVKAGVSIEELAEDIARRTLLQSLNVRPVARRRGRRDRHVRDPGRRPPLPGARTAGQAEASGQDRAGALRRARSGDDILAEDDSLAENVQRAPLHPLDQFRAFQALREKGQSEEDIAAAFFVGVNVVKQRLRLAVGLAEAARRLCRRRHVARAAHGVHRHGRSCAPGAGLGERSSAPGSKEPYQIRRMLTETHGARLRQARAVRRPRRL